MLESPDRLAYWINEREFVRDQKEAGKPKPWSEDWVFQKTYFTNVHREDDKVTKWVRTNWPHDRIGLVVLARMFNLPEHLERLLPHTSNYNVMIHESKKQRNERRKCFNGAYLITTCGVKMDKIDYVYRVAQDANKTLHRFKSLATTHAKLTQVNGLGDFLSAQVIADLKNTKDHPLQNAPDWWTWCAPGPGSIKGIRCIDGYQHTSLGGFLPAATQLYASIKDSLDVGELHMQDFQNALCEFSKYVRVSHGGRSKRRYPGA